MRTELYTTLETALNTILEAFPEILQELDPRDARSYFIDFVTDSPLTDWVESGLVLQRNGEEDLYDVLRLGNAYGEWLFTLNP